MYGDESICRTRYVKDEFDWGGLLVILLPGIINIVGCAYYYIMTIRMLRVLNEKWHWGLLVYPLILVFCLLPTMVRRFFSLIRHDISTDLYRLFGRVLFGSQGFLNSLAYGLSKEIIVAIKGQCCASRNSGQVANSFSDDEYEPASNYQGIN